jgi:hypothetical protein
MGSGRPIRIRRSTEASSLPLGDDTAVTVSKRLSGGTGSVTQSHLATLMVYPMWN